MKSKRLFFLFLLIIFIGSCSSFVVNSGYFEGVFFVNIVNSDLNNIEELDANNLSNVDIEDVIVKAISQQTIDDTSVISFIAEGKSETDGVYDSCELTYSELITKLDANESFNCLKGEESAAISSISKTSQAIIAKSPKAPGPDFSTLGHIIQNDNGRIVQMDQLFGDFYEVERSDSTFEGVKYYVLIGRVYYSQCEGLACLQ